MVCSGIVVKWFSACAILALKRSLRFGMVWFIHFCDSNYEITRMQQEEIQ